MTGSKTLDKFIEFFNSNAGGVISTMVNAQLEFNTKSYDKFNYDKIVANAPLPCVIITINFKGKSDFQAQLITSSTVAAAFGDMMMLGTGEADYNPDEHNDSIKEIINTVLGSLTTELNAEGITLTGMASEVAEANLEIQKEFLNSEIFEIGFYFCFYSFGDVIYFGNHDRIPTGGE